MEGGFIDFNDVFHCNNLPQLDDIQNKFQLDDLNEELEPSSANGEGTDGCFVHVSSIPYEVNDKDLQDYLESILGIDTILSCKIMTERKSSKSRGFGFVQFRTEELAVKALELASEGVFVIHKFRLSMKRRNKKTRQKPKDENLFECSSLHLGCLISHDILHVLWSSTDHVMVEIEYSSGKFRFSLNDNGTRYKIEWRFKDIQQIDTRIMKESKTRLLFVKVWDAPQVYQLVRSLISGGGRYLSGHTNLEWSRTTDFTGNSGIGQSFTFCAEIPALKNKKLLEEFHQQLYNFQLGSNHLGDGKLKLEKGVSYSTCQILVPILCSPYIDMLPFELAFDLNFLVQRGYLSGPSLGHQFYNLLQPSVTPIDYIKMAMERMLRRDDTCYNPEQWFTKRIREFQKAKRLPDPTRIRLDEGQMYVRRIMVTPCKVYFLGPEIDDSNRVTRHFKDNIDDFLRVSFVEEDADTLSSTALTVPTKGSLQISVREKCTKIYDRVLSVLQKGVAFGGKRFEFLAFSSSQLRERSLWMFASNEKVTAENIRSWLGDFWNIRNVAKCAARMGQSFSSSTKSLDVEEFEVEDIPDIEKHIGGVKYCFSDGIGKISASFAAKVARKCGLKILRNRVPSAFQIRYRGYKGVIAVDPNSSYKLSLRPSMNKFPSTHTGLDILNWTHFIPCYLNRQIITLLSTLGIPNSVFEEMQNEVMARLNQVLQDAEVAIEVLQMSSAGDSHKLMVDMLKGGYHPKSEPFLNGMLSSFRANQLLNLSKKARIFISKGRLLMGCLDETATLDYGEVFVQVSATPEPHRLFSDGLRSVHGRETDGDTCFVKGKVIVAKNPCIHPGDVRVLHAVNVPELHHMVDCIVFPQRGPRPHPNECSGSDLDGDLYFVSWDERLIPTQEHEPMNYDPSPVEQLDHAVTIQEIQEYFVNYMVNDNLGIISNAHTVFADLSPDKARDPKCLKLAKLFSVAVDFPKTGVPAVPPTDLRPTEYPDFMEKENKEMYKSKGILGILYREVKRSDASQCVLTFTKEDASRFYDKDMEVSGFHYYVEEALMHKNWYDEKLLGLMNQYEIQNEADLLTGNALNLSRHYQRRPGIVKERIQKALRSLKKEARTWFKEAWYHEEGQSAAGDHEEVQNAAGDHEEVQSAAGDHEEVQSAAGDHEELARASAWYHVTYHPNYVGFQQEDTSDNIHLLSFPWVISDKLLNIKRQAQFLRDQITM